MPVPERQPCEPVCLHWPGKPIHKSKNSRTPKSSSQIQVTDPSSTHTQQHKCNSQKSSSIHHIYTNHSHLGSHHRWISLTAARRHLILQRRRTIQLLTGGDARRRGRGERRPRVEGSSAEKGEDGQNLEGRVTAPECEHSGRKGGETGGFQFS